MRPINVATLRRVEIGEAIHQFSGVSSPLSLFLRPVDFSPSASENRFSYKAHERDLQTMSKARPDGSTEVGETAPDFELRDATGKTWRLSNHRSKVVALVFYPKDETPVCTKQMCSMRDRWADYEATGAEVVGVSVGSVESHKRFAEHHNLPQTLLADEKGEVTRLFGVKSLLGGSQRAVIVIDPTGVIRHRKSVLPIFRPGDDEVIDAIKRAAGSSEA
ncbi:MAG TPA: peroxiredoxin [Blastocatellia bacterium]|nr:peroxiredoxin [Blastocatellia bacterium]